MSLKYVKSGNRCNVSNIVIDVDIHCLNKNTIELNEGGSFIAIRWYIFVKSEENIQRSRSCHLMIRDVRVIDLLTSSLLYTSRSTRHCPGKFSFNMYMQNTHWAQEHLEKPDQWGAPLANLFVESLGK
jgi:hypothetical protein